MPKIGQTKRDPLIEAALAELAEFESASDWRYSRRGNFWRAWDGKTVSIFKRDDESYGWCVADEDEKRFSNAGFDSVADAMSSLGSELGIGEYG